MESNYVKKRDEDLSLEEHRAYIKAHLFMRVFAFATTLAAALCMGLNRQTSDVAGYQATASYKSSPAFKLFVVGNGFASCCSLLSVFFVADLVEGFLFHLLDLMTMGLLMASAAAATAIAYVGKKGNDNIGWFMVCPYYEKFCHRTGISLVLSYMGFMLFFLMCALSTIYKTRLTNNL